MKTINSQKGFTLMELLVATTVFMIVVALGTGIFIRVLRTQETIANISETMSNVTTAIEQMAREIRVGYGFEESAPGTKIDNDLSFTNGFGQSVEYALTNGRITRSGVPITSEAAEITNLKFYIQNDPGPSAAFITILVNIEGEQGLGIDLQTSVSSRIVYDENN